jgi:hypothetical protein
MQNIQSSFFLSTWDNSYSEIDFVQIVVNGVVVFKTPLIPEWLNQTIEIQHVKELK